jgi:hypothetical protein
MIHGYRCERHLATSDVGARALVDEVVAALRDSADRQRSAATGTSWIVYSACECADLKLSRKSFSAW